MSNNGIASLGDGVKPIGTLKIGDDEVHVWYGSYNAMQPYFSLLNQILSETERNRCEKYRFPVDRHNYISRHGILRVLISRYLSIHPKEIQFGTNQFGKPVIQNGCRKGPLCFNMSSSNKMMAYAFTRDRSIGVDIEFIRPMKDMDAIVNGFLSPNENAEFNALPVKKRQEAFYKCWTQKEAFVKALGDGLFRSLDQFDVSVIPGTSADLKRTSWDPDEASRWSLKTITPAPGYIASLAVEGREWSLSCLQLTPANWMQQCTRQKEKAGSNGTRLL